jgi:V/A-type H+/Na+-transporting ATPase subunit D
MKKFIEPTKTNLIRLKSDLAAARAGYEILDRKREILIQELTAATTEYKKRSAPILEKLAAYHARFADIKNSIGPVKSAYITIPRKKDLTVETVWQSTMGLKTPAIKILHCEPAVFSIGDHSGALNGLSADMHALAADVLYMAESGIRMRRLRREIDKTQKRLRALENIHIAHFTESIKYITAFLEEGERDELVRYKKLKKKIQMTEHL